MGQRPLASYPKRPMAAFFDRLIDRLPAGTAALVRTRLAMDAFFVAGGVFVLFRLFNIDPWTLHILDLHVYWVTRAGVTYAGQNPFLIGSYLYSPVFAQFIGPLTAFPWPVFAASWTILSLGVIAWLVGRWSLPVLFSIVVALELYLGQIDILIAAAIVVGFRYPVAWAFPILTKVAPGIGLLWFLVRREWRNLAIAIVATVGIAAISTITTPDAWRGWLDLIRRSVVDRQTVDGSYLGIALWLRIPVAVALIVWGARTNRFWTVPVAVVLAMPILWINVFTILIAVIPLRSEAGLTPARAWLLRPPRALRYRVPSAEPG